MTIDTSSSGFLEALAPFQLEDIDLSIRLSDILDIVKLSNDAIMDIYKQSQDQWNISHKAGEEPLTLADMRSNEIICKGLKALYGDQIPIISEEMPIASNTERQKYSYFWLVDPLDGTKEFIKKNGQFTVNVGLAHRKEAVLGVSGIPAQGIIFFAAKGLGAYKMDVNSGVVYPIKCSTFNLKDSQLRCVSSLSHSSKDTTAFIKRHFKDPEFKQFGASIKLLMLAEGTADIYPRLHPCNEWDTCAPHAVLKEAGGDIYVLNENSEICETLKYQKDVLINPSFVAFGRLNEYPTLTSLDDMC